MRKILKVTLLLILCLTTVFGLSGCSEEFFKEEVVHVSSIDLANMPEYTNTPYVIVNDNQPEFDESMYDDSSFEYYSELDDLGRCGSAIANVGIDLMPTDKRGSIGQVKPTGWHTVKYDNVDGKYLYNRCHLIGFQLTAENANEKNLITGTRYMNVDGMLPFENMVADYIKESKNHVLYRVTPIYNGNDLIASGVQMEAYSIEDKGEGILFNVYVYNVQPGISIDYTTGESYETKKDSSNIISNEEIEIRGNKRSKVYHMPGQRAYEDMENSKNLIIFDNEQEAIDAGYHKAQQ